MTKTKELKRPWQSAATKKAWADPKKRACRIAAMKLGWAAHKKEKAARITAIIERVEAEEMPRAELMRVEPQKGIPDLATLDRLIQKRVAEAQATAQGVLLEPWFQPALVADELRRRLGSFHRHKFAICFDLHGCFVCRRKTETHAALAMCNKCYGRLAQWLRAIEKQYAEAHPHEYVDQQIDQISRRVRSAERILGTARPIDSEGK